MKRRLLVLLILLFAFSLAHGQPAGARLDTKQLARAERFVQQLEQFDKFICSGPDATEYRVRLAKISAALRRDAGSLPEGDAKTEMATAVYWYEQLALNLNHSASPGPAATSTLQCDNERPGSYQKLCETSPASARDRQWAKARLHLNWARAAIAFQQTGKLDRPLDDLAVERQIDRMLATRIIKSLKVLQSEVISYRSLGEFEASGKLARVPFADFKRDLARISADAESTLVWLPQNMLKSELSNALHSFQDGAFWWEQIDQPRVVKVSDLAFADSRRSASQTVLLTTMPYTIAINWRHAGKYLRHAEQLLND